MSMYSETLAFNVCLCFASAFISPRHLQLANFFVALRPKMVQLAPFDIEIRASERGRSDQPDKDKGVKNIIGSPISRRWAPSVTVLLFCREAPKREQYIVCIKRNILATPRPYMVWKFPHIVAPFFCRLGQFSHTVITGYRGMAKYDNKWYVTISSEHFLKVVDL